MPLDPTSLNELAAKSHAIHIQRHQPSKVQCSELSHLQSFVRSSKTTIIDPLFAYLRNDPLFIEAQIEAESQAQLPLTIDSLHSVKTPQRCPVGTGHRRLPALRLVSNHADNALVNPTFMDVDLPKLPRASDTPILPTPGARPPHVKATRERRSSRKPPRPFPPPPRSIPPKPRGAEKPVQTTCDKPRRCRGPRSDTFKMAWSVEEQRLLERLLEEIPVGEKNRSACPHSHTCLYSPVEDRFKMGKDFASNERTANASTGREQGSEVFREAQEVRGGGAITHGGLWSDVQSFRRTRWHAF